MKEKILGYILLTIGIVIILASGISVFMVFTKRMEPVKLFQFSGIAIDMQQLMNTGINHQLSSLLLESQQNLPPQIIEQFKQKPPTSPQKQEIIPADIMNGPINYFAHVVLMGFIASIGMKIAQLGTLLLRPIHVSIKEKLL